MGEIMVQCPHCGQQLEASDDLCGTQVACPSCGGILVIPPALRTRREASPLGSPTRNEMPAKPAFRETQPDDAQPVRRMRPEEMFCSSCGKIMPQIFSVCPHCGARQFQGAPDASPSTKKRTTYQLLAFFLGGLGVHNFYAGRIGVAFGQLSISVLQSFLAIYGMLVGAPAASLSAQIISFGVLIWIWHNIFAVSEDGNGNTMSGKSIAGVLLTIFLGLWVLFIGMMLAAGVISLGLAGAFTSTGSDQTSSEIEQVQTVDQNTYESPTPLPRQSGAYESGYEEGQWRGTNDRNFDNFNGVTLDAGDKSILLGKRGYQMGTSDAGDFWRGYNDGYLKSRY